MSNSPVQRQMSRQAPQHPPQDFSDLGGNGLKRKSTPGHEADSVEESCHRK